MAATGQVFRYPEHTSVEPYPEETKAAAQVQVLYVPGVEVEPVGHAVQLRPTPSKYYKYLI